LTANHPSPHQHQRHRSTAKLAAGNRYRPIETNSGPDTGDNLKKVKMDGVPEPHAHANRWYGNPYQYGSVTI
jgi:hypothetical protein